VLKRLDVLLYFISCTSVLECVCVRERVCVCVCKRERELDRVLGGKSQAMVCKG
jgi:hypothetical protein